MRGKACRKWHTLPCARITPAYAGKRSISTSLFFTNWDHPRLCGEKFSFSIQKNGGKGSPPPMRGKVQFFEKQQDRVGITPAYAGKRFGEIDVNRCEWDHPRLCGEKVHTTEIF